MDRVTAAMKTGDGVTRFLMFAGAIFIGLFAIYFVLGRVAPGSDVLLMGNEDHPVEYAGALFWISTSILCALRLFTGQSPRFLLIMWMLFALVFFGEEISWGQRILGFETPDAIMEVNDQNEFNFHNAGTQLIGLNTQWLFRAGFAIYFLALPLVALLWSRARDWTRRLGYVRPDTAFLVFVWGVIIVSVLLQIVGPEEALRVTVETRESFYAFSVLVYTYLYLRTSALPAEHATGAPQPVAG